MNKKVLVIYNSKTGFTERYAKWLTEEIPCDLLPYDKRDTAKFNDYGTVVFGGWFHAGSIVGFKWFKEQLPRLSGKAVAVFATGATPLDSPEAREAIAGKPAGDLPFFYLQGGLNYEIMGVGDKLLMSLFRKMMKKIKGADSEMYQMLCQSYDISSKKQLAPLLQYLKEHV